MVWQAVQAIHQHWPWFWLSLAGILGLVFGSFAHCAWFRLKQGISLRHPPSFCPSCGTRLGVPDLVPLLSWLILRGRCRHCGTPFGPGSFFTELACAAIAIAAAHFFIMP